MGLLLCLLAAAPAEALTAAQLRDRLTNELRAATSASGAYAVDLETGRVIVSVRARTARIPASVQKMLTAGTVLLKHGPAESIETSVLANGTLDEDGRLAGSLVLVGGGDPSLDEDGLRRLAREVRDAGVGIVTGSIVADEARFDRLRGTPRTGGAIDPDLGGRLGALVIGRGYQDDPAVHVARRFRAALVRAGVTVRGRARAGKRPADGGEPLASLLSPAFGLLAQTTLVPSDNFYAEMLLKELGASFGGAGTSAAGAAVVRDAMAGIGVTARVHDGSGLSRGNRISPRETVDLVDAMLDRTEGASWRAALAVAGRSGTVADRMRGSAAAGRCSVKTGTLRGVSNLAGVCATPGGDVAFAWLMNGGISVYRGHRVQDRMTALLARYSG